MWSEVWAFLKVRKRYWLLPLVVVALVLGALALSSGDSRLSPFLYEIF